jgi:hypothetical protein
MKRRATRMIELTKSTLTGLVVLMMFSTVARRVSADCNVDQVVTLTDSLSVTGQIVSLDKMTAAGDIASALCSASLCNISTAVTSLKAITSNSTFCNKTTCDRSVADIAALKFPALFSGVANTPVTYDMTNYQYVEYDSLLDPYNSYVVGGGYQIGSTNPGVYHCDYTMVLNTKSVVGLPGGTPDTLLYSCAFMYGGSRLAPTSMIGGVALNSTTTLTGNLILPLLIGDTLWVACKGNTESHNLPLTLVSVLNASFNVNKISSPVS